MEWVSPATAFSLPDRDKACSVRVSRRGELIDGLPARGDGAQYPLLAGHSDELPGFWYTISPCAGKLRGHSCQGPTILRRERYRISLMISMG